MNPETSNLPKAVEDCHALLGWIIPHLDGFPRARRFTLGERIESGLLFVLERLVEAAYARQKADILQAANLRLDVIRHLWRLSHSLKGRMKRTTTRASVPPVRPPFCQSPDIQGCPGRAAGAHGSVLPAAQAVQPKSSPGSAGGGAGPTNRLRRHFASGLLAVLLGLPCLNPARAVQQRSTPRPSATTSASPSTTVQAAGPASLPDKPEQDACTVAGENLAPTMALIPPGQFLMGSPSTEKDRYDDEGPRHWVTIPRPFAISRCEITRGQFRQFVEDRSQTDNKPYQTVAEKTGGCRVYDPKSGQWNQDKSASWANPGFPQTDNHPVVCVAWQDARDYAEWLSRRTGARYRLPTESEWEYAARAGTLTSRYWGDDPNKPEFACGFANLGDAELSKLDHDPRNAQCSDGFMYTSPVASFRPNHFGLYDMAGNAWEWVEDCWHDNYEGAPDDGSAWTGDQGCDRGVRGGSWFGDPRDLRSALRFRLRPGATLIIQGFRLARAL
jgi:formylglycine-generating enzyme required for sulfatase activity